MFLKWLAATLRWVGGCIALFGALMLGLAWSESRLPYENERYFDGVNVHLQQAVEAYTALALLSFMVAALSIWCGRTLARR
jgi:hypothetical protein